MSMLYQMNGGMDCAPKARHSIVACTKFGVDVSQLNGHVVDATFVGYERGVYGLGMTLKDGIERRLD
jgi:hypothetical protein